MHNYGGKILWTISPLERVLEALTGSLPKGVPAEGLGVLEISPPKQVLEVLRGLLPEGVAAVLSAKWMNTLENMIYSQSDWYYCRY